MKKILSFVAVAAVMMFAGKANAQLTIHAGYQNTTTSVSGDGATITANDGANGFYAGVDYNIGLGTANMGVAPGAMFSYHKDMMDLRIPVMFNWSESISNDMTAGVGVGPIFNIGLAGDMYGDTWEMKRFDIAVGANAWIGYKQARLEFGYSYGLLNRFSGTGDYKWTINKFYVGLGYTL